MRHQWGEALRRIGILEILLSGFCFGFLGVLGKWAFAYGLSPGEYLGWRFLTASGALSLFLAIKNPRAFILPRPQILRCLGLGAGGYAVFSSCFFSALNGLSASLTVLLLYTYPVLVCLGAALFFGERLRRLQLIALPLVIAGLAMLVWGEFKIRDPRYLAFGAMAAIFYSLYILASSRWLKNVPALSSTFYIMLGAGITLGVVNLRHLPAQPQAWGVIAATALVSTLLAMGFFLSALQKISSAEVSILSAAEPVTGIALAVILLGENLSALQWLGGALVLAGMLLVAATPTNIAAPLE
ncbi:MAG: DMT family transporter [Proteobacteria bacterium]|nr:MAG: DMT family transporter [Pseudomonadota bacterium]